MFTSRLLQGISNLFHPLLMMTYASVALFTCTYLSLLPVRMRLFLMGEVSMLTCLLPILFITILYKLKVVGHWALRDRGDRALPLFVNVCGYAVCTWALARQGLPVWALAFFIGATALAFVCWVVSFWWKISAHAAGMAAFTTVAFVLAFRIPSLPLAFPLSLTIATGLVGSIRVYLGRHTLAQVAAGATVGCAAMTAVSLLWG